MAKTKSAFDKRIIQSCERVRYPYRKITSRDIDVLFAKYIEMAVSQFEEYLIHYLKRKKEN